MSIKEWLLQDKISHGILLGLIIQVPFTLLFAALLRLAQNNFHLLPGIPDARMLLLGVAVNIVVMRFYFLKFKLLQTAKGILLLTVIMILLFFFFLKNSNFAFPF